MLASLSKEFPLSDYQNGICVPSDRFYFYKSYRPFDLFYVTKERSKSWSNVTALRAVPSAIAVRGSHAFSLPLCYSCSQNAPPTIPITTGVGLCCFQGRVQNDTMLTHLNVESFGTNENAVNSFPRERGQPRTLSRPPWPAATSVFKSCCLLHTPCSNDSRTTAVVPQAWAPQTCFHFSACALVTSHSRWTSKGHSHFPRSAEVGASLSPSVIFVDSDAPPHVSSILNFSFRSSPRCVSWGPANGFLPVCHQCWTEHDT